MKLSIERESLQTLFEPGDLAEYAVTPRRKLPAGRGSRRSYQSAKITRLNRDFLTSGQSQLPHAMRSLRILRSRSRELARNNDYFIKFLRMCRRNVIGPNGMRLQCQAKKPRGKMDDNLNSSIEAHWQTWSHPENASANQRLSWLEIQLKWITMLARDGEVLQRKVPADNPYGYALKFLDPAWLDETYNDKRPGGNRIIMSVEVDSNDRHVAYWLTPPGDAYYGGIQPQIRQRTRVPAEEIYFDFIPFDQNCGDDLIVRGIPWAHAAMIKLWHIGAFEDSAIIAARIGASKMGFFKKQKQDELGLANDVTTLLMPQTTEAEAEGPRGPKFPDGVEPGQFDVIDDYDFTPFDPKYPSEMVEPFLRSMLRGVAASLGPEYFTLTSDLTQVNFSAGRLGVDEERDHWRVIQVFGKEHLVRRRHLDWLRSGMLAGSMNIEPADLLRLNEPKITARGYDYYDPLKDVQADETAIAIGTETRSDILARQGREFSEVLEVLKAEQELADEAGIDISPSRPGAAQSAADQQPANSNDPNAA
jgi:lambda family phage portal protein